MSFTPLQIITLRTPQFTSDPRLTDMITLATNQTGDEFGDCKNNAIALRVMHWLTKEAIHGGSSTNSGVQNSGQIISEKEGDLSRSYGKVEQSSKHGDLSTTAFGVELIGLMDSCLFLPRKRIDVINTTNQTSYY